MRDCGICWWGLGVDEAQGNWKQAVLSDFSQWLDGLPEAPPEAPEAPPAVDLHALVSAFAALRQEVRLQSRAQAKAVRGLEQAIEICEAAADLHPAQAEQVAELEARVRREVERRGAMPFLDVRDALVRGHAAAVKLAGRRGLSQRPPSGVDGVVKGYEMAIASFDRALSLLGIARVPTVGHAFDARTMTAVDVRTVDDVADEEVLSESRSGFVQAGEVLRPAEVVVNRGKGKGDDGR